MAEILAEAVEAVGRQERSPPAGHGHPANAQHHESPQHRGSSDHKRSADPQHISQNCAGGRCNQNNIAAGHGSAGFFPSIAQNCANGACNQNNVLRRKREVLAHLLEEARKIAEEEVEAEEAISRRKREVLAHLLEEARKIAEEEVEAEEAISRRKREEGLNDDDCLVGPSG